MYSRYFSRIYFISLQPIFPTVSLTIFDFTLLFFNMFSKLHVKLAYTPPPPLSLFSSSLCCQSTVPVARVLAQTIFRAAIKTQKFVQCAQFISVANTLDLSAQAERGGGSEKVGQLE